MLQLALGADHIELIPDLGDKGAVGNDHFPFMDRHAEQNLGQSMAAELTEGAACHMGLRRYIKADHIDAALGKGLHGEGRGGGNDSGDLLGGGQVRVYDHVQADLLFQHIGIPAVLGAADPGDGVARPQLFGDEAAEEIRLIQIGHGDDQVRRLGSGLLQDADGGAISLDAHDIQGVLRPVQRRGAAVYHGNIVVLSGQLAGNGIAHFTVSHNDDFHSVCSSSFGKGTLFALR